MCNLITYRSFYILKRIDAKERVKIRVENGSYGMPDKDIEIDFK